MIVRFVRVEPRADNFYFGDVIIEDSMTAYPRLDEMTACQITRPILNYDDFLE